MRRIGIGWRPPLARWLASQPVEVGCVEITAEHFFDREDACLWSLAESYPLMVHGLGLSLGTPGPLDAEQLERFARVVELAQPLWVSEHVAFSRTADVDLGHLNPIPYTEATLDIVADHAREISERCGRPLILENVTSHLDLDGTMSETAFLNRLCERAGCGLLLDVTNLFVNSRNRGLDPRRWLHDIDPRHVVQLHVVGYSRRRERWEDFHSEPIQEDLGDLIAEVCDYASPRAVTLERDGNFPSSGTLAAEIRHLEALVA